eukprot:3934657-Rhodomonas_salina.1
MVATREERERVLMSAAGIRSTATSGGASSGSSPTWCPPRWPSWAASRPSWVNPPSGTGQGSWRLP